jgi:imidazolonepropionase-like amidohydrolase
LKLLYFSKFGIHFDPLKPLHMRIFPVRLRANLLFLVAGLVPVSNLILAQETFPVNGVADHREKIYALIHGTIIQDGQRKIVDGTLVIREGKIESLGSGLAAPAGAEVIDCRGKYIYPSFIDIYSDYGITAASRQINRADFFRAPAQLESNTRGAFGWNQAIRPETDASKLFEGDEAKAKILRDMGFGTVLTHQKDGIARGTGVFVTLADKKENLVMIKDRASAHYSFNKGSSSQSYPSSMMGIIALLRQTYLDASWYKSRPPREGENLSLEAWVDEQDLPQIFEANDKWNDLRADRIGDEFGVQYIIKGGGNEYQRIQDIAATHAGFILPLNFPQAMDVEDPNDARFVSLADMKHWELAPGNPAAFEKAHIPFCLTTADLRDPKLFSANLKKALEYGLSEGAALEALTKTPASFLGLYDKVGSLETGKLANFLISTGPLFHEKTEIIENWVQGEKYAVKEEAWLSLRGTYTLTISSQKGNQEFTLNVESTTDASILGRDTIPAKFTYEGNLVRINFSPSGGRRRRTDSAATPGRPAQGFSRGGGANRGTGTFFRLSGYATGDSWSGNGEDSSGQRLLWTATLIKTAAPPPDSAGNKALPVTGQILYPFNGYGWVEMPHAEDLLIRNATVWTNEKEGRLLNTDVLVKGGKIAEIGKSLSDPSARVIDGTGKWLTPGIIDEHSHIAASSINEGAHSVTSEVRIGDNLNPEDINIYRQLSGGVTSSHILHGSANTIGGQTQLIKLRWGMDDEGLKFRNWDPFIKFALGENVKRTTSQNNNRFPDTRMGVEEVLMDAFQRASDYREAMKKVSPGGKAASQETRPRRDLQLDALVEILNKKRFITCHSYVQSEITALMRVAEKFGFRVNTFTHILEGYKVADKIKEHGANASTFSDWWAYKIEVQDAIAYNATIMQKEGLNVCINSDDPEMARRLNQEAAKSVKYGGMSEEEAFNMVTLNPAKALHVQDRVGSIRTGKDADLVLWSDHPLSIYAKPEKTIVDGIVYFDLQRDSAMRRYIASERGRLEQKMIAEKKSGGSVQAASPSFQILLSCGDHDHHDGLITIDVDGEGLDSNQ